MAARKEKAGQGLVWAWAGLSRGSNGAREILIKGSRIPLDTVAARKGKAVQSAGCGDGLV